MSLARSIVELRAVLEKEGENPDQYYSRVGKCPPGFTHDGTACVKGGADPEKPGAVSKDEPAGDGKTPSRGDKFDPDDDSGAQPPRGHARSTAKSSFEPVVDPYDDKRVGDLIRSPVDSDGWTKGDHMAAAQQLGDWDGKGVEKALHAAATWLQKKWDSATHAVADKLDNLSKLAVAYTSKRNKIEDKAAAALEESPEEYAKKLRDAVPPEMVKDTEDAIDSFADEKDPEEKKKKKKKVSDYAEKTASSLIFGLLAAAFAPIAGMALIGNWMAKKVGINIFGKSDEAAGDVVKNLDELDAMIVQEAIVLLRQGTSSKDMEAAVQQHIDEEGEMPKQEEYVILDSLPLNVGGQLSEWVLHESKPVKKWTEL